MPLALKKTLIYGAIFLALVCLCPPMAVRSSDPHPDGDLAPVVFQCYHGQYSGECISYRWFVLELGLVVVGTGFAWGFAYRRARVAGQVQPLTTTQWGVLGLAGLVLVALLYFPPYAEFRMFSFASVEDGFYHYARYHGQAGANIINYRQVLIQVTALIGSTWVVLWRTRAENG